MKITRKNRRAGLLRLTLIMASAIILPSTLLAADEALPIRKLSEYQYRNTIADIFGKDMEITGRFEPELRSEGLLALGASVVSVTPSGFEQYDQMARSISAQFVEQLKASPDMACGQSKLTQVCANNILEKYGAQLFRRPLSIDEVESFTGIVADTAARKGKDNYAGLESALSGMMLSPPFLFRIEEVEINPERPEEMRLTAYSKAQRISYFLWNTIPDESLLKAAANGELHTESGLTKQVSRMLSSTRIEQGVRALFADMFMFDEFDSLVKDPAVFSRFNFKTAADAEEETLRVVVEHLLTKNGDYRELYTTRDTFLTPSLGVIYRVPVQNQQGWTPFTFSENDPKAGPRGGLLTHASFLALHSHPGRSSVTLRGQAVRELLLCQKVPTPPANVNFAIVMDTNSTTHKTGRDRVLAHQDDPACAGCHKITDNIGLALENYDSSGVFRATENGVDIDATGNLDGKDYDNAIGLGQAVADHPATSACFVRRTVETGLGRPVGSSDRPWLKEVNKRFATSGYSLKELLRDFVTSDKFLSVPINNEETAAL